MIVKKETNIYVKVNEHRKRQLSERLVYEKKNLSQSMCTTTRTEYLYAVRLGVGFAGQVVLLIHVNM